MSRINDELIRALKDKTPGKGNTVNLLMDILSMGKEAAYRRLRGEIPFTLEEAAIISEKLNISLDSLFEKTDNESFDFKLEALFSKDPLREYYKMINDIVSRIEQIADKDTDMVLHRAYRCMPTEFMFRYDSLTKIYIYILFYQLYYADMSNDYLREMRIPQKLFDVQRRAADVLQSVNTTLILDKHIFDDYIGIVKYFLNMGLIDERDVAKIKSDLLLMLDDMEKSASTGYSKQGKAIDMYISQISFDATYSYMEGAGIRSCSVTLFCIDHLSCLNKEVTENHRLWIKSLVRFSTQISVSGELQRNMYFSKQRHLVETML